MDHAYIEEHNIVARYEMKKLSEAECARFEEHFVDCRECQDQLAAAQDFRQALRTAAATGTQQQESSSRHRTLSSPQWMLASAALVALLAVSVALLARETYRMRGELDQTRTASATWQRQYESEHQTSKALEQQLQQTGQKTSENTGATSKLPVLASVFVLNKVRSGETSGSTPANFVVTSRTPQWIVLSLDTQDEQAKSYRVTLAASGGQQLWSQSHLVPTAANTLSITLPSSLLAEGDYVLTVEGLTRDGAYAVAGRYTFRRKLKL